MKLSMPRFDQASVLVVGDVMLDRYWHGGTSRISPEAPVPVVRVEDNEERAGGAGNVALNIAALGAQVSLIGLTGEDEAADALVPRGGGDGGLDRDRRPVRRQRQRHVLEVLVGLARAGGGAGVVEDEPALEGVVGDREHGKREDQPVQPG